MLVFSQYFDTGVFEFSSVGDSENRPVYSGKSRRYKRRDMSCGQMDQLCCGWRKSRCVADKEASIATMAGISRMGLLRTHSIEFHPFWPHRDHRYREIEYCENKEPNHQTKGNRGDKNMPY